MTHGEGRAEGVGRTEPAGRVAAAAAFRISRSADMNCVGRATMGEGFAENSGRWLGQMRTVPSQRVVIGSQQILSSIGRGVDAPTEDRGIEDGDGLQMGIPIKHWNRVGSQQTIDIEDGMGRCVGLGVKDADRLNTR